MILQVHLNSQGKCSVGIINWNKDPWKLLEWMVLFCSRLGCAVLLWKAEAEQWGEKLPVPIVLAAALWVKEGQDFSPPEQINLLSTEKVLECSLGQPERGSNTHRSEKPAARANSDFTVTSLRGDEILPHTFSKDLQDTLQSPLQYIRPWHSTGNNSKPEDTSCKDTTCREDNSHKHIFSVLLSR